MKQDKGFYLKKIESIGYKLERIELKICKINKNNPHIYKIFNYDFKEDKFDLVYYLDRHENIEDTYILSILDIAMRITGEKQKQFLDEALYLYKNKVPEKHFVTNSRPEYFYTTLIIDDIAKFLTETKNMELHEYSYGVYKNNNENLVVQIDVSNSLTPLFKVEISIQKHTYKKTYF